MLSISNNDSGTGESVDKYLN